MKLRLCSSLHQLLWWLGLGDRAADDLHFMHACSLQCSTSQARTLLPIHKVVDRRGKLS